jgi:hypothetical protein
MHKAESGKDYYVAVDGSKKNTGTIDSPWSLDYAAGGAGGQIGAGDTVWVRGGTYRRPKGQGFTITVSGTAIDKITFRQCPGETVILDGSLTEFTTIGNTAWEPCGTLTSGHNVYCSHDKFPMIGLIYYGGFIQIDGDWYSLAPHTNEAYIASDTHQWESYPCPRYLGPGISQTPDGYLFIRLDNSPAEAQLGRPVPQISDPDPRHHSLYICSSRFFGLTITGSHLVIEDFAEINNFGGCLSMKATGPGQTDVTIRNCGGRPIYFGVRCAYIEGLTLDSCNYYAHMPSDKWWVSYADIKGGEKPPADHVRKVGLDLGIATHVEVVNCLFDEFFDGILAPSPLDVPAAHHVEIHRTTFNQIWDDAWQMTGQLSRIDFHHNFCYGAGPSLDSSGTSKPNPEAGTVYIHHNVIDTTKRLVFWGRIGAPGAGMYEAIPCSRHSGAPNDYTWPRKFYYNTIVTGQTLGTHPYVGWDSFGAEAATSEATHEVYNNIFNVIDGRPGGRDFYSASGREIYDGNVYWFYRENSPSRFTSPWQRLHMSTGIAKPPLLDVTQLQASQAFRDSKTYYAPGWEFSGLSEDPQLDSAYKPQNPHCQTGAVDLTTKNWPGTETSYEAWRGAIQP